MHADNTFIITFDYQGTKFSATVSRICSDKSILFELKFASNQYIFVKSAGRWIVVSDFEPCEDLKQRIINHLRRHLPVQTASPLIRLA